MVLRKGFSVVEIVIVLGVVVLLAGVGYVGWKALTKTDKMAAADTSTSTAASTQQSAEVITTKADLEAAEKALDELNFEDESVLEAEEQADL